MIRKPIAMLATTLALCVPAAGEASATQKSVSDGVTEISYSIRGEGPLIVILPSVGRGAAELAPVADHLAARGYTVALPEPRGIAGSTGPANEVTLHDYGDDIAQVIRAEHGPAIVVGHAYGVWVAKTAASDHPDLVRGVVVVAGGAKHWPRELLTEIRTASDLTADRDARLRALRVAFFTKEQDATEWLEGWHPDLIDTELAASRATTDDDWWRAGTVPILDLIAAQDPFRPADSRMETRQALGDRVTVQIIEGASHALPVAMPDTVATAIADWADGLIEH